MAEDVKISLRISDADLDKIDIVKRYILETQGMRISTSEVLRSCVHYRANMIRGVEND